MSGCIVLYCFSSLLIINFYKKRLYLSCIAIISFCVSFLNSCFLNHLPWGSPYKLPVSGVQLGLKETSIVVLNLAFLWIFLSFYHKKFNFRTLSTPPFPSIKKIFYTAILAQIFYSLVCFIYWKFYLHVPMFGWLFGDNWHKYRTLSNDFWNSGSVFFHLATYKSFLVGLGILHLIAAFVFLKKIRYKLLSMLVLGFQFFMVLHKSFIANLMFLGTYIFFTSFFLKNNSRFLGNKGKYITCFCFFFLIGIFIANQQRQRVAHGSVSLISRYKGNALGDLFILSSNHSFLKCNHWNEALHSFKKIFNIQRPGLSLGRQLYIDIYGYEQAKHDRFPTWWPTPVSGFIYLCGYCGIFIGSFFMATLLFFLEYIFRKSNLIIYSCVGYLVLKIYLGWIFNWFLISGLIPLCVIYIVCCKLKEN